MILRSHNTTHRQRGAFAVEFGLVAMIFFVVVYGVLELLRALYLHNTLQEVTRRAAAQAAVTDFTDAAAIDNIRNAAVFRNTPGILAFGLPITNRHVHIDYLALARSGGLNQTITPIPPGAMPGSPAANRAICLIDPNADNCIRLVRVRICLPESANCDPVPYQTVVPLIKIPTNLPTAETVTAAESLGFIPGSAP